MKALSTTPVSIAVTVAALLFAGTAQAAAKLSISMKAEHDVTVTDASGKTKTARVEAKTAAPGDTLYYTITYRNSGDETATNAKLDNPVPEGTAYVADSAWGKNTEMLFSIDGGKTFKKASALTYEQEGKTRTASPDKYNALRWIVPSIPAGSEGSVGFSAVVK